MRRLGPIRRAVCACGGVIVVRRGDRVAPIVACHNATALHERWRERREPSDAA